MKFKSLTIGNFFKYNNTLYVKIEEVSGIPYSSEIESARDDYDLKEWSKFQIKYNALRVTNGKPALERIPLNTEVIYSGCYPINVLVPAGEFYYGPYKELTDGQMFISTAANLYHNAIYVKLGRYVQIGYSVKNNHYEKAVKSISISPYSCRVIFVEDEEEKVMEIPGASFIEVE